MIWAALLTASAQDHPPGATISDAVSVNVTRDGLDQLGGIVGGFLPTDPIVLDPISLGEDESFPSCLALEYYVDVENVSIDVDVTDVEVVPSNGQLDIMIGVEITINAPSNPFTLDFGALCINGDCNGHVSTFPVDVAVPLQLAIVPGPGGQNILDATVGDVVLNNGLMGDQIELSGCAIGTIENILNFFGISLYDFVLDFAEDFLIDEIQNQVGAIETTIEDAFSAASIDESFEVLPGVELQIALEPSRIDIVPEGLGLALDGSIFAELNECVAFLDPNGSRATASLPPAVGAEPAGTHVGLHASDDLINQAMYAVWRSGLLCQNLEGEAGGFALDTNLLGLLGGDGFRDLFPETKPVLIQTVPLVPLEAAFGGAHQIDVPVQDVDVRMFAELDGRQARVLSVAISPDLGIDLEFDGTTGNLAAAIELGEEYNPRISGDMVVPNAEETILNSFGGVLGTIIDGLAGDLLSDAISFPVPSLDGFGLVTLTTTGVPDVGIVAQASVGTVPYTSAGCDGGGDCGGGGCSSTGGATWAFLLAMTLMVRRRR